MPLKIIPPRKGKSPNYSVRGTYCGIYVDKSCGSHKRSVAAGMLRRIEAEIESGDYGKAAPETGSEPTFLSAAIAYMADRSRNRYIAPLIRYFGETPLSAIDQSAIDTCAQSLYPRKTPVTRNAYVYMPISAILHHAGLDVTIRRPKGFQGRTVTNWLSAEDAGAVIEAAESFDGEFALLLKFLLYTGVRLGGALALTWDRVDLAAGHAYIPLTKNGDPIMLRLRDDLRDQLERHGANRRGSRVFRMRAGGFLYWKLDNATLQACGMPHLVRPKKGEKKVVPPHRLDWVNFHTFRHTWATWMRQYGGLDVQGLVATGNWRNVKSAMRYAHTVPREEWAKVEDLPSVGKKSA
jgi:integrase